MVAVGGRPSAPRTQSALPSHALTHSASDAHGAGGVTVAPPSTPYARTAPGSGESGVAGRAGARDPRGRAWVGASSKANASAANAAGAGGMVG